MKCRLCHSDTEKSFAFRERVFYQCVNCKSVQVDPDNLPSAEVEKERYSLHNNSIANKGYVDFLMPLIDAVRRFHTVEEKGLDFGSGPEPVLSQILRNEGFSVEAYDPVFRNNPELLDNKYNYLVCCEVIEHFHNPSKEFELLSKMMKSGGELYFKTNLLSRDIDFDSWWYKNDITHVFFYSSKALEYIRDNFNFSALRIEEEYFILKK
ncbi:class I SAM-dependent methyltransferase [Saccharicrinis sp. FJH2]|uniref:class I SAM-dependent methyltransferase n=1 Tax=Saccharicrinis sp. FJH65 TaxID=3344659 RepID=UPI0035F464AC